MKPLLVIPILMLAACASRTPKKAAVVSPQISRAADASVLRTNEQLREYRFGRYVDPGDPLVIHEGHPIYRVETTAGWNLRPGSGRAPASRTIAAAPSVSANDAVVAEVNKQRAATRAFTEQTTTLNQRLGEMTQATAQTQELAKQNVALKRDLAAMRERLDSLDAQFRDRPRASKEQLPTRTEDKW